MPFASVVVSLAIACAFFLDAPAAHAQEPTEKERIQIAREAFDAGQRAFDVGDLDGAIATWKQGYESKDDPLFLLKIATAYEKKSDIQKALFYYKAYLHDAPRSARRSAAERHVAELEAKAPAAAPTPEPTPEPTPPPASTPTVPDEPPPGTPSPTPAAPTEETHASPGHGMKVGGIVIGSAGVVLVGVGVIFALSAHSIQNDLEASTNAGMPWSAALSTKESSGRRDALLGKLGVGFGAAALVTGTTLFVLGGQKDAHAAADESESRLEVLPVLGPDGSGVTAGLVVRGPW